MAIIGTYGSFTKENDGRLSGTVITIHAPRRDGKFPVDYAFGTSGKRIRKLYTLAQCEEAAAKYGGCPARDCSDEITDFIKRNPDAFDPV